MKYIRSTPNSSGAYPAPGPSLPRLSAADRRPGGRRWWPTTAFVTITREPDPGDRGLQRDGGPGPGGVGGMEGRPAPEPEPEPAMAEVISLARMTAQVLPDAQALQVPSLYPLWAAGTAYGGKGEAVIVRRPNGYLYRCQKPHTAQTGWEPETTAALWAAIQGSQAGTRRTPSLPHGGMEYQYGLYYLDPEDSQIYLCRRTGEEEGGKSRPAIPPTRAGGAVF